VSFFYFLSVAFEKKLRSAVAAKDSALDIGLVNHVQLRRPVSIIASV